FFHAVFIDANDLPVILYGMIHCIPPQSYRKAAISAQPPPKYKYLPNIPLPVFAILMHYSLFIELIKAVTNMIPKMKKKSTGIRVRRQLVSLSGRLCFSFNHYFVYLLMPLKQNAAAAVCASALQFPSG